MDHNLKNSLLGAGVLEQGKRFIFKKKNFIHKNHASFKSFDL